MARRLLIESEDLRQRIISLHQFIYGKDIDKTVDGSMLNVLEQQLDALSFTEAEKRITEEMSSYISGEFEVDAITRASYKEIFFSESESADRWYKVKVQFITIDEKTEKEKRMSVFYLVQAANIDDAKKNLDTAMSGTMIDYEVVSVVETKIMDVYEYTNAVPSSAPEEDSEDNDEDTDDVAEILKKDELIVDVARSAVIAQKISTGIIQRTYQIGYHRAGRIKAWLDKLGVTHPKDGVLIKDLDELDDLLNIKHE